MHFKLLQTIVAFASLASLASAFPTPSHNNTANNTANTNTTRTIALRQNPTAPRDRLIIDQMKTDGLPSCYRDCMVENADSLGADIYTDDLHAFCDGFNWDSTVMWIVYHVQFCIPDKCGDSTEIRDASNEWMEKTCDRTW